MANQESEDLCMCGHVSSDHVADRGIGYPRRCTVCTCNEFDWDIYGRRGWGKEMCTTCELVKHAISEYPDDEGLPCDNCDGTADCDADCRCEMIRRGVE
jgi:hypothetical protein